MAISPAFIGPRISTDIGSVKHRITHNVNLGLRVSGCVKPSNFESASTSKSISLSYSNGEHTIKIKSSETSKKTRSVSEVLKDDSVPKTDHGSGGDDGNRRCPAGGGGGGGGSGEEDDTDEKEFGPTMKYEEVMREAEMRGVTLPSDMLEAAKTTGIRSLIVTRYLDLQGSYSPLGFLMKHCRMLRDRILTDPSFLFKVGAEVVIDSCCATFVEAQKRGKDFWAEFELYAADLLVGMVVDITMVGMLAPYARFGNPSISSGCFGGVRNFVGALPSSVFERGRPGCRFSMLQRVATYFYKGVLCGSVGFGCSLIAQGIGNMTMTAKRRIRKSEEDIPVPPLLKSAALFGAFLAVSSNTRYQVINGLEFLVEALPLAKQVPLMAMAFTVCVRFANNIYGRMQFDDCARWSDVQY